MSTAAEAALARPTGDARRRPRRARRVLALLGHEPSVSGQQTLLDVAAGSGWLAHQLAALGGLSVMAVAAADRREVREGFVFRIVAGPELPFDSGSFDFVVSDRAIESFGDVESRRRHLSEVGRVLKPGGIAYLSSASRWGPLDFRYWLPERPAQAPVSVVNRSPGLRELRRSIRELGFESQDCAFRSLLMLIRSEFPELSRLMPALERLERQLGELLGLLSPMQMFRLRRPVSGDWPQVRHSGQSPSSRFIAQ